jgi:hypothetical protein
MPEPLTLTLSLKERGDQINASSRISPSPLEGEGRGEGRDRPSPSRFRFLDILSELVEKPGPFATASVHPERDTPGDALPGVYAVNRAG